VLPVIVIVPPPASGPDDGVIESTPGWSPGVLKAKVGPPALVPAGVVTNTLTTVFQPGSAGVVSVMVLSSTTVTPVAAFGPNMTLVASVNPLPLVVTGSP
jgi:hypothetical protein